MQRGVRDRGCISRRLHRSSKSAHPGKKVGFALWTRRARGFLLLLVLLVHPKYLRIQVYVSMHLPSAERGVGTSKVYPVRDNILTYVQILMYYIFIHTSTYTHLYVHTFRMNPRGFMFYHNLPLPLSLSFSLSVNLTRMLIILKNKKEW